MRPKRSGPISFGMQVRTRYNDARVTRIGGHVVRRIISLLVVTFVLTLAACQGAPAVPALQTPPIVNEGATMGVLNVSIIPEGAEVLVDGVVRGDLSAHVGTCARRA